MDWLPREPRFEVVYGLLSLSRAVRLTLKVAVGEENPRVPDGHRRVAHGRLARARDLGLLRASSSPATPTCVRILLPEDWVGWPLRKDSPLGYEEVAFTHNTPDREKPSPGLRKLGPKKVRYRAQ